MEEQNVNNEGGAGNPANENPVNPAVTQEAPSYFDRFSKDFGVEVKDDDSYAQVLQRLRNPEPVAPKWNEPWQEQFFNGMSSLQTEAERRDFLNEFATVNGRDWDSVAQSDYAQVLKTSLRMENPKLSENQINALYNRQFGNLKTDPKAFYDTDGQPTVESPQEEADYNSVLLQQSLEKALRTINAKKASFAPKQGPDWYGEVVKSYPEAAKATLSSLQFGSGESTWKPGAKDVEYAANPNIINTVLAEIYTPDGKALNPAFFAKYAAMQSFFTTHLPDYAKREQAKGTAKVLDTLENPSGRPGTQTPAGQRQTAIDKAAANQLWG